MRTNAYRPAPRRRRVLPVRASGDPARGGFTMIELLLVLVIMLLTTAVAAPSFVRSFRGARLRASARTIVMTHRHARSMAVLQQKQIAVLYDTANNSVEVVSVADSRDTAARSHFLDERGAGGGGGGGGEGEGPVAVESELVRYLERNIRIADFQGAGDQQEYDGIYWMNYYPNGMCDGYELTLADEKNRELRVDIDAYSGKASVEKR